jgi:hypothetical protein
VKEFPPEEPVPGAAATVYRMVEPPCEAIWFRTVWQPPNRSSAATGACRVVVVSAACVEGIRCRGRALDRDVAARQDVPDSLRNSVESWVGSRRSSLHGKCAVVCVFRNLDHVRARMLAFSTTGRFLFRVSALLLEPIFMSTGPSAVAGGEVPPHCWRALQGSGESSGTPAPLHKPTPARAGPPRHTTAQISCHLRVPPSADQAGTSGPPHTLLAADTRSVTSKFTVTPTPFGPTATPEFTDQRRQNSLA